MGDSGFNVPGYGWQTLGEELLFRLLSCASIAATMLDDPRSREDEFVSAARFVESEKLEFLIEHFTLNLDADAVRNCFRYNVRKRLDGMGNKCYDNHREEDIC